MKTFFENQTSARNKTLVLLLVYVFAVCLIVCGIYLGLLITFFYSTKRPNTLPSFQIWQPELFLTVSSIVVGIVLIGTLTKLFQLRTGGDAVAQALNGRLINPDTIDPMERKLLNVVEEIAIASGIRIPKVYLLDSENGINAFAAGYKPNQAVIGVSKGCINFLNREELQGVIAHEFSHILNGDMRLNIKLIGVLHGIILLTLFGRLLIRSSLQSGRRSRGKNNPAAGIAFAGVIFVVIGAIGIVFAKLIKMAVSRQREFLADASSVQFTRNPSGIANALRKIGGLSDKSYLKSPKAEQISHLCFSNALSGFFNSLALFSTHPPLDQRIKKIDPYFDGTLITPTLLTKPEISTPQSASASSRPGLQFGGLATVKLLLNSIGKLNTQNLEYSQALITSIPTNLKNLCNNTLDAGAVLCLMLLNNEKEIRAKQLESLAVQLPALMNDQLLSMLKKQIAVEGFQRLLLLDLALPALNSLTATQYTQLKNALSNLIKIDQNISIFEYCLFQVFSHSLETELGLKEKVYQEKSNLADLVKPASNLLFALAFICNEDQKVAEASYNSGCDLLGIHSSLRRSPGEKKLADLDLLDQALIYFDNIQPNIQEKILKACITCVISDGKTNLDEINLVRAISSVLDCPMPPLPLQN